jgi:hypothetical protein
MYCDQDGRLHCERCKRKLAATSTGFEHIQSEGHKQNMKQNQPAADTTAKMAPSQPILAPAAHPTQIHSLDGLKIALPRAGPMLKSRPFRPRSDADAAKLTSARRRFFDSLAVDKIVAGAGMSDTKMNRVKEQLWSRLSSVEKLHDVRQQEGHACKSRRWHAVRWCGTFTSSRRSCRSTVCLIPSSVNCPRRPLTWSRD